MELSDGVLLIFCGLGVGQSLFLAAYLFTFRQGNTTANRIFAVLLFALAIRLTKSLVYYYFSLDIVLMNLGYAAHAAVAPLLLLYLKSFKENRHFTKIDLLHFVPVAAIILLSWYLPETFWLPAGYSILLYYSLGYLAMAWLLFYKNRSVEFTDPIERRWVASLLVIISFFNLAYFSNFILGLTNYITGPVVFSLLIYYLSYMAFRYYNEIFGLQVSIRRPSRLSAEEGRIYVDRLEKMITENKPHLRPDITLPKLADQLGIPGYRLSQVINQHYQQSFSDWINTQRVEEAKRILSEPSGANKKISAVAFESGFNTLSAFNLFFKRTTGLTPSEFRRRL